MSGDQLDIFGGSAPAGAPRLVECPTCSGSGRIDPAALAALLERPGQVRADSPGTSRTAGSTPRKGSQRHQVLRVLFDAGPLTAYAVSRRLDRSPNQTATRLGELHDDLFVRYFRDEETGRILEAETTPGNTGMVHQITALGVAVLGQVEGWGR